MQTCEFLHVPKPLVQGRYGVPAVIGRMPPRLKRVLLAAADQADLAAFPFVWRQRPVQSGVAIGNAALAHPGGLFAQRLTALGARREEPSGFRRAKLRKLTVFVSETHREAMRRAITAAGAAESATAAPAPSRCAARSFRALTGSLPYLGSGGAA